MGIKEEVIRKYVFGDKDTVEGKILKVSISKDCSKSRLSTFDLTATINDKNEVIVNHGEEEIITPLTETWTYNCRPTHPEDYPNKSVVIKTGKLISIPGINNDGITYSIKLSNGISNYKTENSKIKGETTTVNTTTSTIVGKITASSTFYILVLFTNNATVPVVKAKHINGFNIGNPFDEENNLIYNSLNEKVDVTLTSTVTTTNTNNDVSQGNIPEAIKKMEAIAQNENIEYNEDGDVVKYENTATGISYTETHDHDGETEKIWRLNDEIIDREYTRTYNNGAWAMIKDKYYVYIMTGSHNMNYIDLINGTDLAGDPVSEETIQKIKDKYRVKFHTHQNDEAGTPVSEETIQQIKNKYRVKFNTHPNDKARTFTWDDGSITTFTFTCDDESTTRTDIVNKTTTIINFADRKTMKTIISDHDIDVLSYVGEVDVSAIGYHTKATYSDMSGVRYNMDTDTYYDRNSSRILTGYSDDFVSFGTDKSGTELQLFHSYLYNKDDIFNNGIYIRDQYGVPHKFKIVTKEEDK